MRETIIDYLDRIKEVVSKFREIDAPEDGNSKLFKKRFWRKLLGPILIGVGDFLKTIGNKLANENP